MSTLNEIAQKKNLLILIRGIPGCGKSTMAKHLKDSLYFKAGHPNHHFENDMYHMVNGQYKWTAEKAQPSMDWCLNITRKTLESGSNVIVSNTFTSLKRMQPYADLANELGVIMCSVEPGTPWKNDPELCFGMCDKEGVTLEIIQGMKDRWEEIPDGWGKPV